MLAAIWLSVARGWCADAGPDTEASGTETLSPFRVEADKDDGFVPAELLSGTRMATPLAVTPLAYSVVTHDFIEALHLTDIESALAWSVGAYAPQTSTQNYKFFNFEGGSSIVSRGIQTNAPLRNFFLLGTNADTYAQERIDFARGPNALLIGTGGLGGTVSGMTKTARLDRDFTRAELTTGSWNRRRATLDVNRPLGKEAALRLNLLGQEADGWRDLTFDNRRGVHVAMTWALAPRTQVRVEYEYYRQELLIGVDSVLDRVSGWDGRTVVAATTASIVDADRKGLARNGSSSAPYRVFIPGSDGGTLLNWANTWTTLGGAANSRVPVGGVTPASAANLGVNGGAIVGSVYDSRRLFGLAETGSDFFVPGRTTVIAPDAPNLTYRFQDAAVFLEHREGDRFFLEAAVNYARVDHLSEYIEAAGLAEARVDVNQTLPDGRPNPGFRQVYGEAPSDHTHFDDRIGEGRLAAALVFEGNRWGDVRTNVVAGGRVVKSYTTQWTEVLALNPDVRRRPTADTYLYRYYWSDPRKPFSIPRSVRYVDPVAGSSGTVAVQRILDIARPGNQRMSDNRFVYAQASLAASLLDGRLSLMGGLRRDVYQAYTYTLNGSPAAVAHDFPADWSGDTLPFRPAAPDDYYRLIYVPKDASGAALGPAQPALARPRVNGVPLAQYAGDRFQDDFSAPRSRFLVTTASYGGVYRLRNWAGLFYNYAKSFVPPVSGVTLTGAALPPSLSRGWDAGVRFAFAEGRINLTVGRYDGRQAGVSFDSTGSTRKYADIASANAVGDLSPAGVNARGLPLISSPTFDFRDRVARGGEIELTANLTERWRLTGNASWPQVRTLRNARDEWAYLRANESALRQIVLDAGALIDSGGVASVDAEIPADRRSPDVSAAAAAWNAIQAFKKANDPQAVVATALPQWTANLYTDYAFRREGWLDGFRVGAGIQMLGRRVIGNRGADTAADPQNPASAIDDPSVDSTIPVYRRSYYTVFASVAYQRRLSKRCSMEVSLSVANLLNDRTLIYTGSGLRPPGGDLSRPDRVTVPTSFVYQQPRSYTVSATVRF
ncbi:hypothetical protein DB347_11795 [Opitutaceae bacterium EW11]|nr:hypothetical protein DB347_11795 [Opitutaceae bacterium EW11]